MADYEKSWKKQNKKQRKSPECCQTRSAKFFKKNLLLFLLILSLILGIAMGALLKIYGPEFSHRDLTYFRFPGDLLMRMLKCLIIPLITSSLISGLGGLDTRASGKMGMWAIVYYLTTTLVAVLLGILLAMTIRPGEKVGDEVDVEGTAQPGNIVDSFLDLIRNIFPDNIIEACFRQTKTRQIPFYENMTSMMNDTINSTMCNETYGELMCNVTTEEIAGYEPSTQKEDGMNVLGLVVFSIALGIVTSQLGEVARPLYKVAFAISEATMLLVTAVIWYSPIGIMFLVASEIVRMEDPIAELEALGMYMGTVILGLMIHGFIILPLIYLVCVRKNPFTYLLGALQALLTALGTASSSATLPVTYRCLEENNHIDSRVTRFVLPVGATINMDGTALYEAVAALFIAQTNGMDLDAAAVVTVSLTATLASIGAASVPQAGLVTMIIVLTALGIDSTEVTKILAVDWLLDRIRTMINVWGDAVGAAVVQCRSRDTLAAIDHSDNQQTMAHREIQHGDQIRNPSKMNFDTAPPYSMSNGGYVIDHEDYHMLSTKF